MRHSEPATRRVFHTCSIPSARGMEGSSQALAMGFHTFHTFHTRFPRARAYTRVHVANLGMEGMEGMEKAAGGRGSGFHTSA